jgi:ectoine hydroxylase-related dioxygenase (phytanoyl-CoA dioxygenase family)
MASQIDRDLYCLRTAGFVVLRNAVDQATVSVLAEQAQRFEDELDEFIDRGGNAGLRHSWPLKTTRCMFAISVECQDVVMSETVQTMVNRYLGDCVLRDCLVQTNMPDPKNAIRGIDGDLSFHRDTRWTSNQISPEYLHAFVLLTDCTRENGATVVVPGSHLVREPGYYFKDTDPHHPQPGVDYKVYEQRYFPSALPIEAPGGSLVFLDPMCIHSQGINVSTQRRSILNMTFRSAHVEGLPRLINARRIAENYARVPMREDLMRLLEDDDRLPAYFGPLGSSA